MTVPVMATMAVMAPVAAVACMIVTTVVTVTMVVMVAMVPRRGMFLIDCGMRRGAGHGLTVGVSLPVMVVSTVLMVLLTVVRVGIHDSPYRLPRIGVMGFLRPDDAAGVVNAADPSFVSGDWEVLPQSYTPMGYMGRGLGSRAHVPRRNIPGGVRRDTIWIKRKTDGEDRSRPETGRGSIQGSPVGFDQSPGDGQADT